MADEFQPGNGSWWDTSRNSATLNGYGWPAEMVDRDSATAGCHDDQSSAGGSGGLQMMGLGLSSGMDWNQALLHEKGENSLLQQDLASDSGTFQPPFSSQASSNDTTITSQSLSTSFQVDSGAAYALLLSENRTISNYPYPPQAGTNNLHATPFWNAPPAMTSSFFPPLQNQTPSLDAKPKSKEEGRELTKKNSTNKRTRSETPSPFPAFKVRKEKMGDRITALQQLVSPFGKTDTASVLSEAIEYIKFLHEQVTALSAPYMKNGALMQNQQNNPEKSKDLGGGRQDLRSRGLCLVPVSSTFPVTHETSVDFWTPTFGGTFR
ncbi:transcription factor bHLH123 [Salvia divinorum]|uniref:Transcription factor bHLH123 n=1 Tax=Salvia divinorum TaxID=28513 RepID=A0ABD1I2F4_SALDI